MQSTRAILIRLHLLTDSSLIVHWLTEDFGLIRVVAKGARRAKSPFAGRLDLFFGGEIVFQRSNKSELHALRDVVIRDWREKLRGSYGSLMMAGYWCQLLGSIIEPEHPDPVWYDLLDRAMKHLEDEGASHRAMTHFESELVRLLGMTHASRANEEILGDFLGGLPKMRQDLLERFPRERISASQT